MRRFLSRFEQVPLNAGIAERAVTIRRATCICLPDAIIHASTEAEHALLVSRNTKDFSASDPWIRVPYIL